MSTTAPKNYPKFKLLLFLLLAINTLLYSLHDSLTSTLDAFAWLVLLITYELETLSKPVIRLSWLRAIRNGILIVLVWVFFSYVHSADWLDIIQTLLWYLMIVLLELEVRWPAKVQQYPRTYSLATLGVFASLTAMVVVFALHSAWLDSYDALLWLIAFATLDVDILKFLKRHSR